MYCLKIILLKSITDSCNKNKNKLLKSYITTTKMEKKMFFRSKKYLSLAEKQYDFTNILYYNENGCLSVTTSIKVKLNKSDKFEVVTHF